jgi:hypothetical protein
MWPLLTGCRDAQQSDYVLTQREGRQSLERIAKGVIACSERRRGGGDVLPPTTRKVPERLKAVSGRLYRSRSSDWKGPGWSCIAFKQSAPQRLQHQWLKRSRSEGVVRLFGDRDGDGRPETRFELTVRCDAKACAMVERVEIDTYGTRREKLTPP